MRVYFDNAATTPMHPEVIEVMSNSMAELFGNPSSIHGEGRKVRAALEDARKRIAKHINASIGEVFFTSGGTEANNMAIKCAVRDLGVKRVISSPIEHHCGLHAIDNVVKHKGVELIFLDIDAEGNINLKQLENYLEDCEKTTLVSLMHANNEIGTLNDIDAIGEMCEKYSAFFHSDTVQTVGHFPIDVKKSKVHFISAGAHKFHGPKGVGFIYINSDVCIKPYIDGGSQERNMRAGTENVYGILGMAKALDMACEEMESHRQHVVNIRTYLKTRLQENFLGVTFSGNQDDHFLYTVLSVSFPPTAKSDLLLLSLDIAGISASGGSACSSGADAGSHVIAALPGADAARTTIRFSFSALNTCEEVDFLLEKLTAILATGAVSVA